MKMLRPTLSLAALLLLGLAPVQAQWSTASLTRLRTEAACAVAGTRAYVAGGRQFSSPKARIDVYDEASGVWSVTTPLSVARSQLAGAVVGPYVLFAGGATSPTTSTDAIDFLHSGTGVWGTYALSEARYALSAVTVGTKVLFAGGAKGGPGSPTPTDTVDVYDSTLGAPDDPLAWSTAQLSIPRGRMSATSVGGFALFAGGIDNAVAHDRVDVFDGATGLWSIASLSVARLLGQGAAATVGTKAYFAGGTLVDGGVTELVDVYDSSLGTPDDPLAWSANGLSVARGEVSAVAHGSLLIVAGGLTPGVPSDVVDVLETGSGHWGESQLSLARFGMAAGSVGDRVLFAGGISATAVGVDRVDLLRCRVATVATFAGDGINADTIAPVAAALGQSWSAPVSIGHSHGTGGPLVLNMRTGTLNGPNFNSPVGGRSTEILIGGPLLFSAVGAHDGVSGDVPAMEIPVELGLLGQGWAAQYTVLGGGFADFSQAVAGTIGRP